MFSYRTILGSAWTITKQHKKLWIFGFLAFLLSAGGEYQILTKILNEDYGASVYDQVQSGSILLSSSFWSNLYQVCYTQPRVGLGLVLLIVLLLGIAFTLLWVCIKSQIALVKWTKNFLNSKNKAKNISVWAEISSNDKRFWTVLGLNIVFKILITTLFFFLSLPLIFLYFKDSNFAILIYTIFFVIFLPLAISMSLIIKYSIAGVILEKQSFVVASESGYRLFCKNWLVSLEMAILLFLINFLTSLLAIFVLSVVLLPIILTLIIFNLMVPLYLTIAVSFLIIIVTAAILMTFQTATWTILFLELKGNGVKAKLERIFDKKIKNRKTKK
ncbi:MAG: hypothetical protein WCK59_00020 [Candidatus Falkowbacteria bacterium]